MAYALESRAHLHLIVLTLFVSLQAPVIPTDHVKFVSELGEGAFGRVYLGILDDGWGRPSQVAVSRLGGWISVVFVMRGEYMPIAVFFFLYLTVYFTLLSNPLISLCSSHFIRFSLPFYQVLFLSHSVFGRREQFRLIFRCIRLVPPLFNPVI